MCKKKAAVIFHSDAMCQTKLQKGNENSIQYAHWASAISGYTKGLGQELWLAGMPHTYIPNFSLQPLSKPNEHSLYWCEDIHKLH